MSLSWAHVTNRDTGSNCVLFRVADASLLTYASDLVPKITCQVEEPGLISASGFEHPASTLSTRFPAALGIGHDLPAA